MRQVHADEETSGVMWKATWDDLSVPPGLEVLSSPANASETAQLSAAPVTNEPSGNALLPAAPAGAMHGPSGSRACGASAPLSQLEKVQSLPGRTEDSINKACAPLTAAALPNGSRDASCRGCKDSDAPAGPDLEGHRNLLQDDASAAEAPAKRQTRSASGQLNAARPSRSRSAGDQQLPRGSAHEDLDSQSGASSDVQVEQYHCVISTTAASPALNTFEQIFWAPCRLLLGP